MRVCVTRGRCTITSITTTSAARKKVIRTRSTSWKDRQSFRKVLEFIPFAVDVVLGFDAEADVVEVLVRLRDVLAFLADEDAREFASEYEIGEGHEFLVF